MLDGRNRLRACIEKGIPPTFREWTGPGSPLDLVISLNLQRRHLTQSQRAMIAARLATLPPWRPGKSASIDALSQNEAGERLDVSRESVQRARKVLNSAIPELVAAVDPTLCRLVAITEMPTRAYNHVACASP